MRCPQTLVGSALFSEEKYSSMMDSTKTTEAMKIYEQFKHMKELMINVSFDVNRCFFFFFLVVILWSWVSSSSPRLPERGCAGSAAARTAGWSPREDARSPPASASLPHGQLYSAATGETEHISSLHHASSGLVMSEYGRLDPAVNSPRRLDRVLF